jgi:hypothetical protein
MLIEIKDMKIVKESLNEGTWAIPKPAKKRLELGIEWTKKIEDLKEELYPVFGDDILFDGLDGALKRLEELMYMPDSEFKK